VRQCQEAQRAEPNCDNDNWYSNHPRHRRKRCTRCSCTIRLCTLEEEFTLNYNDHWVYSILKENLIMVNKEFEKLPQGTPVLLTYKPWCRPPPPR
jgi:hypothetical protein